MKRQRCILNFLWSIRRKNWLENRNVGNPGCKITPFTLEFMKTKKEMTWRHQNIHPDIWKEDFKKSEKKMEREGLPWRSGG